MELAHLLGKPAASQISILYGGSVTSDHAPLLMAKSEIDGLLVGGASLDPKSFAAIAKQSTKKKA
jgi:triosephosphate isomerase